MGEYIRDFLLQLIKPTRFKGDIVNTNGLVVDIYVQPSVSKCLNIFHSFSVNQSLVWSSQLGPP